MPAAAAPPLHPPGTPDDGTGRAGGPAPGHGPAAGLDDLLVHAAQESPDKLALVEASGRSLTWRELDTEVARVATGLGDAGVVAGYRVVLVLGNRLEMVTGYLAVLRAQAVAVPLDPASTPAEVARALGDSGARMVLADAGSVTAVRAALAGLEVDGAAHRPRLVAVGTTLLPGERSWDHLRAERGRRAPVLHDAEQLAVLLYTSGTTGSPRAAMLSHRALRANVEQVAQLRPPLVHGDDVVLGLVPMSHVYGLCAVLGAVLRQRAKLVMADAFDPVGTLDLIEDEACSVLPLAPGVLDRWRTVDDLAERLGPVRLVLSGSAPLDPGASAEFTARTGLVVHQGYGLTETAPVVASTHPGTPLDPHAVGRALPGVGLRLVDAERREVAVGDPGEVEVCGPHLFSGYWPEGHGGPGPDGWWATGDVGLLDAAGDLVLVDRLAETIVVSGFTVYPAEVEAVLAGATGVQAVAVVGADDPSTGYAVVAHVVPAPGAEVDDVLAAVDAHAREHLAAFKRPARVVAAERLPRTRTGKVARARLRDLAADPS